VSSTGAHDPLSGFNQQFDPPQYLLHATGHDTASGVVANDWFFLYPDAPESDGTIEIPGGTGGTVTYITDHSSGPYNNPIEVCGAEARRLGSTLLQSWSGGDAFSCQSFLPSATVPAPASASVNSPPPAAFLVPPEVNEILTGVRNPPPPDRHGAAVAAVAGAIALTIFAISNYLVSGSGYVQSALKRAGGREPPVGAVILADTRDAKHGAAAVSPRDTTDAASAPRAEETSAATPSATAAAAAAASADSSLGGDVSTTGDTDTAQSRAGARVGAAAAANWTDDLLGKAVDGSISAIPDASDVVKDQLIGQAEKREKRERLLADKKRLEALRAVREKNVEQTYEEYKRAVDSGKDDKAQLRAWKQAQHELEIVQTEHAAIIKELAALDGKKDK
jgi:hypothetical protein